MKNSLLLLLFSFPVFTYSQQSDSAVAYATLHIFYPAEGARGTFKIYMEDSLVWKAEYNSRKAIQLYKEGKTIFWTPPQKQYSVSIDVKFGGEYFLQCGLQKGELILMPVLKLVDAFEGSRAYDQIQRDHDTVLARKERRKLDTTVRRNTIYAEVAGPGMGLSLSYDRLFRINKKVMRSVSGGLGVTPWGFELYDGSISSSYNFIFGKRKGHLELGLGISAFIYTQMHWTGINIYYPEDYSYVIRRDVYVQAFPKVSYRYQKLKGGFYFRASFCPIIPILRYTSPVKFKDRPEFNIPATCTVFSSMFGVPIVPFGGIGIGYSFNVKRK